MDTGIFRDCIGKDTDPSNCALCYAVSCFACVHGYCTALEKITIGGCVFYRDADENKRQISKCFYRLISCERFDLLKKYADTMAALGLMDWELDSAVQQHDRLEQFRDRHLEGLRATNWTDTLVLVRASDDGEDIPEPKDPETQEAIIDDVEPDFDNSLDNAVFPEDAASQSLDDETAADIGMRDKVLRAKGVRFKVDDILESITDMPQDELPSDYAEDFVEDELRTLTYEEAIESAEDMELAKEAEREKAEAAAEMEQAMIDNGAEPYVSVPVNFFYKTIGFPVKRPKPPDPIVLAYQTLGAGIVYKAAEDYIAILRMLWSGDYQEKAQHWLIIAKWEMETLIGSAWYWALTNIDPNRVLDQCWATAEEQAKEKIKRLNRRIAAGIDDGEGT